MPKVEDPSDGLEETAQANDANPTGAAAAEQQEDKTQQYIDQISKLKGEIKSLMAAGAGAVDCGEKHIECAVCRELYVDRVHEALRSRMSALQAAPKRKRSDSEEFNGLRALPVCLV